MFNKLLGRYTRPPYSASQRVLSGGSPNVGQQCPFP